MSITPQTAPATAPPALLRRVQARPSRLRANLNLTVEMALAAFKLKYAGSVLGYVWSLIKPLMLFGMLYVVFALFLLKGRTTPGENFPVELLIGIVVWTFFADATTTSLNAVVSNADMILKSSFPRWILVVAAMMSAAMTLAVNLLLVIAVGIPLHWFMVGLHTLWVPALLLELFLIALGAGLLVSSLFVYFRDLGHIWEIVLQFLFYASCIVFPFRLIPARFQPWIALDPLAQLIEDMRRLLVSPAIPSSYQLLGAKLVIPLGSVAVLVIVGALVFRTLSQRFGERV